MPTDNVAVSEAVRRGKAVYQEKLRAALDTPENYGKTLVIDPDSGDYEMGDNHYDLIEAVHARHPDKLSYSMRIGYAVMSRAVGVRSMAK